MVVEAARHVGLHGHQCESRPHATCLRRSTRRRETEVVVSSSSHRAVKSRCFKLPRLVKVANRSSPCPCKAVVVGISSSSNSNTHRREAEVVPSSSSSSSSRRAVKAVAEFDKLVVVSCRAGKSNLVADHFKEEDARSHYM